MALFPKKTYSRRKNELPALGDKEKENMDPFDELLSSPLKQEVQFQPLSFWGSKVRRLESKEKSKKLDCGLFKASDSDEPSSPFQRKWKPKAKCAQSKVRTLQPKSRNQKLSDRRKNYTTAYSCINNTKACKPTVSDKNESVVSTDVIERYKGKSLDCTLYPNKSMDETISHKNCDTFEIINGNDLNRNLNSISCLGRNKINYKKKLKLDFVKTNNLTFTIYKDINEEEQPKEETLICKSQEVPVDDPVYSNKNMDETSFPFELDHNIDNFVTTKRHFNYPNRISGSHKSFPVVTKKSSAHLGNKTRRSVSLINLKFKDVIRAAELMGEIDDESLVNCDNGSVKSTLGHNKGTDKTLCDEDSLSEESKYIMLDCQGENTILDELMTLNDTELEELIQKLLNVKLEDGVVLETSSTSDDTLSSFVDEETVINVKLEAETNDSPFTVSGLRKDVTRSDPGGVSVLTTNMSQLSINNTTGDALQEPKTKIAGYAPENSNYEDKEKNLPDFRNVTTKRRGAPSKRYERNVYSRLPRVTLQEAYKEEETDAEMDFDQSVWITGRASVDWNKSISFINPVLESTRVFDTVFGDGRMQTSRFENNESISEETSGFDHTYTLKPGKKWLRSRSVLKQLQNGTIVGGGLESTRITGRKFESFVQEMLEIQNERSGFFNSLADIPVSNKTLRIANVNHCSDASKTVSESASEKFNNSVFSNGTVIEKSSLNHTVKVLRPEEKPSAFRSALGLANNCSLGQDDSGEEKSFSISARDFILIECGQEDVLPFEEYFNERTLENCRKIGEGVYGEVFMCSDTVIKIIPIEGSDKVNGEPQKTFAEIISEVVIASKLSNLRNDKKHRTDGFSEMKRCWCVKGRYPKYLLQLWNEYDQQGSGSENDSPVMFKDDQLYIILELANGGKDLESFVFSSSAQSLSVFIQAAFSLAIAEKAFEFEHRDLHWGNVLISETNDKFMTVYLDGVEYKIPTKGVKVCIIDFTLSRINHKGCCIFNDLSVDPTLFASEGDYQFEIYRLMLREVKNDWSLFRPKTNIFWLHYTLDKMLKMVRYKNKKSKIHLKHIKDLKSLECAVLEHKDSVEFVLTRFLNDVMNKL